MWDHCVPAPPAGKPSCAVDRATPIGSSSSHRGRLLHRRPRLSRHAGLLHRVRLSRQSGLPPSAVPLARSQPPSSPATPLASYRPPLPSATPLSAKPVSDLSSKHCCAGQMQPFATPSASRPRPPCLLHPQPRSPTVAIAAAIV
ncbi:Os01g0131132 [Oryza sativa Japonica Group]|nr:Os01g0131132 [Oryza sativa Japonica Group]